MHENNRLAWRKVTRNYELYLILLPTVAYFAIFKYGPMYGVQIAFKEYVAIKGINGSPWVGFEQFMRFFHSSQFWTIISNTLGLGLYELAVFPVPIVMALLLNQLPRQRFKRFVQTVTYAPHFISVVVIVGMLYIFLSPRIGLANQLIVLLGGKAIFFLGTAAWFKTTFVFSGVWQTMGWGMIIYLAALASINPELHEAAVMDGANKRQRIFHVDLPGIMPTVMILLILQSGHFMDVAFEKTYLMQNALNLPAAEVIATYVYKMGLLNMQYSYSTAIGLFESLVNCMILVAVNSLAKKAGQNSLW